MEKTISRKKRCNIKEGLTNYGFLIIPLVINQKTCRFIIDSGSHRNALSDADLEAKARFKPTGKTVETAGLYGQKCDTPLGLLSYKIGGQCCEDEFFVIPGKVFASFQEEDGIQISGLLGLAFLKKYHCVIDLAEGTVIVDVGNNSEQREDAKDA